MQSKILFLPLQSQNGNGAIAQLVEQRTENPCVPSSILGGTTSNPSQYILRGVFFKMWPNCVTFKNDNLITESSRRNAFPQIPRKTRPLQSSKTCTSSLSPAIYVSQPSSYSVHIPRILYAILTSALADSSATNPTSSSRTLSRETSSGWPTEL